MKDQRQSSTQIVSDHVARLALRRIWIPGALYEFLPYFYVLAGFAALFATLYINAWYWIVPHWILFCGLSVHAGVRLIVHRRSARARVAADEREDEVISGHVSR
jgi:hypothetical protein